MVLHEESLVIAHRGRNEHNADLWISSANCWRYVRRFAVLVVHPEFKPVAGFVCDFFSKQLWFTRYLLSRILAARSYYISYIGMAIY